MASALKKLFKPSERLSDEGSRKNGGSESPSHQSAALRFFGHCSSPRGSRRDTKISPAEGAHGTGKNSCSNSPSRGVLFKSKSSSKSSSAVSENLVKHSQTVRTRRLMKEFQEISKHSRNTERPPFTVELVDDNLFEWHIKLYQIDPESEFYRDMQETGIRYVLLSFNFPDNFPFSPPFMRVISPHIEKGFVMEGGAICMELLTPRGWASAYTVEAVVMQFAASLVKGQGRIARKCKSGKEFSRKSAEASFRSLVKTHEKYGWVTPPLADG